MSRIAGLRSAELQADIALVMVTLLAAAGWIFSKEAIVYFEPFTFVSLRFCGAGLVLGLIGWKAMQRLSAAEFQQSGIVGCCFGAAIAFWVMGIHHGTHLGVGAFLNSLGVVLVPLVAGVMGDQISMAVKGALLLALAGLSCLMLDNEFAFGWGEASYLASAAIFAVTFVLNSRAAANTSPLALTAIQLFIVGTVSLPLALIFENMRLPDWQSPEASAWGWLLAGILIATCLRFFLQTWGQSKTSASAAAIILIAEPVWSALLAAAWFGEVMTAVQLLGCGLIFSALIVSRWTAVRQMVRAILPG